MVPMWRKPAQINWPSNAAGKIPWEHHVTPNEDTDEWYRQIWHNVETYASALHSEKNQPSLTKSQTGRGCTTEVKWTKEQIAPIKPNRKGDIQSALTTSSLQYSRWTKQVRRLQHYTRCSNSTCSATIIEHRASLWSKILQAVGFTGSFQAWWATIPKVFHASPLVLPNTPPSFDVANAVFLEFCQHYNALETSLTYAKAAHAKQRRVNDPLQIYRDLQRERAEPVQTIVAVTDIPIQEVENIDEDHAKVTLGTPIPEGVHSFEVEGITTAVQIQDPTTVVMPAAAVPPCQQQVRVCKVEADVNAVLAAFEAEWAPKMV